MSNPADDLLAVPEPDPRIQALADEVTRNAVYLRHAGRKFVQGYVEALKDVAHALGLEGPNVDNARLCDTISDEVLDRARDVGASFGHYRPWMEADAEHDNQPRPAGGGE